MSTKVFTIRNEYIRTTVSVDSLLWSLFVQAHKETPKHKYKDAEKAAVLALRNHFYDDPKPTSDTAKRFILYTITHEKIWDAYRRDFSTEHQHSLRL